MIKSGAEFLPITSVQEKFNVESAFEVIVSSIPQQNAIVMKQKKFFLVLFSAFFLSLTPVVAFGDRTVSAQKFADPTSKKLDRNRAAFYLIFRDDVPVSKLSDPTSGQISLDTLRVVRLMGDALNDLADKTQTGHPAPWTWEELDNRYLDKPHPPSPEFIRLRGSFSDLRESDLTKTKGATIGFSNNRLPDGKNTWNSQGALGLPVSFAHGEFIPALTWNVNKVEGIAADQNTEELNFSLPLIKYSENGHFVYQAKPYFQTDFSIDYKVFGAEAAAEYIGYLPGRVLQLGGYYYIGDVLRYQVRIIPKMDYSSTNQEGIHTTRKKGDDWLRAGGLTSLDFQFLEHIPFTVGTAYEFLQRVGRNGTNGNEFSAYGTYWVNEKKSVGLTLKYSKGKTLVAAKKIDLLTVGLEWKH